MSLVISHESKVCVSSVLSIKNILYSLTQYVSFKFTKVTALPPKFLNYFYANHKQRNDT
jgi:hypothetical protein